MADDLPAGALSLEEGTSIVGAVSDPQATPGADVVDDDAVPEGTIEGSGGVKFVPLSAVIAERTKGKESKAALAKATSAMATLQSKADEFDRVKATVEKALPLIQKMQGRPDLLKQLDTPLPAAAEPKPLSDDAAVEYAKLLDLYDPEGKPDVVRAQKVAAHHAGIAKQQTADAIAPYQAKDAQHQSLQMRQQVGLFKDAQGHSVDPEILNEVWANVPPEMSAKPDVASILYQVALAQSILRGKYAGTAAPGPGAVLHTESLGGGRAAESFTELDSKFAAAAGLGKAEFTKTGAKFVPGRTNSLE